METKSPQRDKFRKGLVVISVMLVFVVLVVSALVLVRNARLQQGNKPDATSGTKPLLAVVPSGQDVLSSTSDTAAGDVLQGTAPATNTDPVPNAPVSVKPIKPAKHAACDESRKEALVSRYDQDEKAEDAKHESLLNSPLLEGIQMVSSENKRHAGVVAALNKNLTSSLSAIACTL